MPDIVSRIRVEALGADQAAREIRKLRDAYTEVGQAARNLSPEAIGGGDPFSAAIAAPGGGVYGGQRAPSDIMEREARSRDYRAQVRGRESAGVGGVPGQIGQGMGVAEATSTGRGGAAAGGLASLAGGLLMGPAGIALLAGGAAAMGVQKFADNAFVRMENIFGTGTSQRLGRQFSDIEALQKDYGKKGIPLGMVQSFFQAGSASGLSMNKQGALSGTNWAMEAMRDLGVDAGGMAGLMGALSKSDMDMSRINYDFFGQTTKAVGRENIGRYIQEMARGIEAMSSKGITLTEESLTKQTDLLSGLSIFGGMTAEGAAALSQSIQNRGITAAGLKRPEDIIAYQAMRKEGESLTDTLIRMEEDPVGVAMAEYKYLEAATGRNKEVMILQLSESLGISLGATAKFMTTMEEMSGRSGAEIREALGGVGWQGQVRDEEGKWVYTDPAVEKYAIKQAQMLAGFEKSMFDLTTSISKAFQESFGNVINLDPTNTTWNTIYGGLTPEQLAEKARAGEIASYRSQAWTIDVEKVTGEAQEPWREYKTLASGMLKHAGSRYASSAGNISQEDYYAIIGGLQAQVNEQSKDTAMSTDEMVVLLRVIKETLENALQGVNTD